LSFNKEFGDEDSQDPKTLSFRRSQRSLIIDIAVHGYAAHMEYMMREAKLIAPEEFVIASLQGPNRFWRPASNGEYKVAFGWLNDFKPEESVALHQDFVLKVVEELSGRGIVDPKQVYLYGFSQSCALNFRFAFTHPESLKGIIGVCGGIPSDLDSNEAYSPTIADVLYLYGDDDEFYPLEKFEAYDARLQEYLPNLETRKYKAKHVISNEMRADMRDWLALTSESGRANSA
jgi:predicted esterase